MLPVAVAMPTVPVAEPELGGGGGGQVRRRRRKYQLGLGVWERCKPRRAPETKHKPAMGATTVFACAFLHSVTVLLALCKMYAYVRLCRYACGVMLHF